MKVLLLTFYFPPDLGAGSFRAHSLIKFLSEKTKNNNVKLYIVTTMPNRYASFTNKINDIDLQKNVEVYRVNVSTHGNGMFSQALLFCMFAIKSFPIIISIRPDFIVGTSSRLMTGLLTYIISKIFKAEYFLDIRDIFSESIADVFKSKSKLLSVAAQKIFQKN